MISCHLPLYKYRRGSVVVRVVNMATNNEHKFTTKQRNKKKDMDKTLTTIEYLDDVRGLHCVENLQHVIMGYDITQFRKE
jgi:hypothetical protein